MIQGLVEARDPAHQHYLVESISFTPRLPGDNGPRNYRRHYVRKKSSRVRLPAGPPVGRSASKHQRYLLTLYSVSHVISMRRIAYMSLK